MKISSDVKRRWILVLILLIANTSHSQTTYTQSDSLSHVQAGSLPSLSSARTLDEVVVNGSHTMRKTEIGRMSILGAEINKHPVLFGERDVIKALQSTSGVVSGTEGFAGLYVRGGETDQNLYLVDGLPLLNVYHFGGLFSTFNTQSVKSVDFYKGAIPAIYSGSASSVVNVKLKDPDLNKTTGVFSLGLISGQMYLSTPIRKGRSAISLSMRRTWFDVFSVPALAIMNSTKKDDGKKTIFNYNFTDLQYNLHATDSLSSSLSLLMFYGKDNFKLGENRFEPGNDRNLYQSDLNKMMWGNWGATVDYRYRTHKLNLSVQPYISKAFAQDRQRSTSYDGTPEGLTAESATAPSVLQVGIKESLHFRPVNWLHGTIGAQQTWYDYNVGEDGDLHDTNVKTGVFSGFVDTKWDIGNFQCTAGVRADRFLSEYEDHWNIEPRLGLKFAMRDASAISLDYSRITQYAQQVSSNYIYLPSDAFLPTAVNHKPLVCDIYSAGYVKDIKKLFNLRAELWWKNMQNIAEYTPNSTFSQSAPSWYKNITFAKGWAYGLDLDLEGRYKSVNWSVAYGLMWNWRKSPDINMGKTFPAKFDNRHKLDVMVNWPINDRVELTGQWEYMTGNRITLPLYNIATPDQFFPNAPFVNPIDPDGDRHDGIDYYESRNNVRIPPLHRLNLNLTVKGRINSKVSYQWDFGLYNAYCRLNPFSVVKSYVNTSGHNNGDYRQFKSLSLLPILPSISYTLKF